MKRTEPEILASLAATMEARQQPAPDWPGHSREEAEQRWRDALDRCDRADRRDLELAIPSSWEAL